MSVVIQDTFCKSALTKTGIPGADYAINPYTGCAHACVYCYASFMTRFSGHTERWGTWVDLKTNVADVLEEEFCRKTARRRRAASRGAAAAPVQASLSGLGETALPAAIDALAPISILLSSVTDPYQPIEASRGLTRACLEVLAGAEAGMIREVSVLTKSALVARDIDLLQSIPGSEVGFTITTLDDAVARRVEPGASAPSARLEALERLAGRAIPTWVFIAPVLPSVSDSPAALAALMKRAADAGASRIAVDRMNLYPAAVAGFRRVMPPEALADLSAYRSAPRLYADRLRAAVSEAAEGIKVPVRALF
ncbi:MAG: Radical SAM superfamily protein [Firmicutes bacterium ADurb.Bin506]|nr:MAG: Radical SAM superfamily protein [Firmicutes bacterium ADurb.Bin506]